jgi:predicted AlkP superfamily pyrophosphatase or phosphodiesterase
MARPLFFLFSIFFVWTAGYSQHKPYVILVSFDGFRYDYVDKVDAPNFKSLIKSGTHAEGLIPSFPSKTFPNHYSIVTGLYPGHHGLVDNNFFDPKRKEIYEMKNRKRATDAYYYGGTPLWQLARQQGLKSASFFWVGTELLQQDLRPDYYYPYDESVPDTVRVKQVVEWLKLPEADRPHFITLYFSSPDHEGHSFGPSSPETKKAILNSDYLLGMLMKKIKALPLAVNVIVVSDHGMEELKEQPETYVFLEEILNRKDTAIKVVNGGTQAHVYVNNQSLLDSTYKSLKKEEKEKKYLVYKQEEFPARWHYNVPRAGDLLITANPGFYLIDQERKKWLADIQPGSSFGVHGYDPAVAQNMMGIFFAVGPNIKSGKKIAPFENIHIYPLIATMLGLTTPPVDGDLKVLKKILR